MYCEDVDWCFRMNRAGWQIWYVPLSVVLHYGGKSMKKQKGKVVGAHKAGLVTFYCKYHSPLASAVFRIILWVGYGVHTIGWIMEALRGHYTGFDKLRRFLPGVRRSEKRR